MTDFNWTATFGEVKTAAQWTDLGDNDRALQDGTGIDDGAILPNHLLASASTANNWTWDSFTPTWTNITVGNGTNSGHYIKLGTTVFFRVRFKMGSGSSMGTDPALTLPVTASSNYTSTFHIIGTGHIQDFGTNSPMACMRISNTTTANLYCYNSSSTYLLLGGINSTTPMTWTTNDSFDIQGMYEAAS